MSKLGRISIFPHSDDKTKATKALPNMAAQDQIIMELRSIMGRSFKKRLQPISTPTPKDQEEKKKDKKKDEKIMAEIISTEETYVKNLESLEKFIFDLRLRQIISKNSISHIFSNWHALSALNQNFLKALKKGGNNRSILGKIFQEFGPKLDIYAVYCANYNIARLAVQRLSKNPKFSQISEKFRTDNGNDLSSFLIMPVQRIPRYRLLTEELISHTPDTHPDYKVLEEGLRQICEVALFVNSAMIAGDEESVKMQEVWTIQDLFKSDSLASKIDTPSCFLVRQGTLLETNIKTIQEKNGNTLITRGGDVGNRYLYLFSDKSLLIASKTIGGGLTVKHYLNLTHTTIDTLKETKNNAFLIRSIGVHGETSLILVANSPMDRNEWLNDLERVRVQVQSKLGRVLAQIGVRKTIQNQNQIDSVSEIVSPIESSKESEKIVLEDEIFDVMHCMLGMKKHIQIKLTRGAILDMEGGKASKAHKYDMILKCIVQNSVEFSIQYKNEDAINYYNSSNASQVVEAINRRVKDKDSRKMTTISIVEATRDMHLKDKTTMALEYSSRDQLERIKHKLKDSSPSSTMSFSLGSSINRPPPRPAKPPELLEALKKQNLQNKSPQPNGTTVLQTSQIKSKNQHLNLNPRKSFTSTRDSFQFSVKHTQKSTSNIRSNQTMINRPSSLQTPTNNPPVRSIPSSAHTTNRSSIKTPTNNPPVRSIPSSAPTNNPRLRRSQSQLDTKISSKDTITIIKTKDKNKIPTLPFFCQALYSFDKSDDDDEMNLYFNINDIIKVTSILDDDWFHGELGDNTGIFPRKWTKILEEITPKQLTRRRTITHL